MEIFGATAAVLHLAGVAIGAVYDVLKDSMEMRVFLEESQKEVNIATVILDALKAEPTLQNHPEATKGAREIMMIAKAIEMELATSNDAGRGVADIARTLVSENKKKLALERSIEKLTASKNNLSFTIGIVNIGLSSEINRKLQELVTRSVPSAESVNRPMTSRTIVDNIATSRGIMLNAPILNSQAGYGLDQQDNYAHIDQVTIRGNQATDRGFMLNYANTLNNLNELAVGFLGKIYDDVDLEIKAQGEGEDVARVT